jgi:OOP family OmpA-OmpF porin
MKKCLLLVITGTFVLATSTFAQDAKDMPKSFGVSFFLNDFATAARIRTTSLNTVLNEKTFSQVGEMSAGLAVNYFKQMQPRMSYATSLGLSGMRYPMPGRNITKSSMLVDFSATINMMMTTDDYYVQPYLMLGVGGHKYGPHYGAYLPAGLGLKLNIFDQANIFVTSTYRVPVTTETANYHFQHAIGVAAPLGKKK